MMKRLFGIRVGGPSEFFRAIQILALVCLALVVGCWFLAQYEIGRPHAKFTAEPLSLHEFYERSGHQGGLPAKASNLFYAHSNAGFTGFVFMYRFDAPAADCVAYGKHLLEQRGSKTELAPLRSSPEPICRSFREAMGLGEVDWFDVETIQSGFEGNMEPSTRPGSHFWIDTDRGRFYFWSSD
jgi:hypothetical protein